MSSSKTPCNPASPDETPASPLQSTSHPTTTIPDVFSSLSTGLQFSISLPVNDQSENTQELHPFNSLLYHVRPFLSRPNHIKFQTDHSILRRQHRREYYTNHARRTKRPRSNQQLEYSLKTESSAWEATFLDSRRQEYTIQSTKLPSQRLVVSPQAITALSRRCRSTLSHQPSSLTSNSPLTHLSHSATHPRWVSPLLKYFAECLHRSLHPMLLPSNNLSLTTFPCSFLSSRKTHLSRMQKLFNHHKNFIFLALTSPTSSAMSTSNSTDHQQFHHHLKAEQLDRRTLHINVLQLQNDFASLHYLLFSSGGAIPISDTSVKNSAIGPPVNTYPNLNLHSNPNPTSNALLISRADEPSVRRFTPEGAVGPPRAKPNNAANDDFQSSTNIRVGSLATIQNLSSRLSRKIVHWWNSNLFICYCGYSLSVCFLIW